MLCRKCGNEMLVHHTEEKENTLIFHYLCANPSCPQYGYKDTQTDKEEKSDKEE